MTREHGPRLSGQQVIDQMLTAAISGQGDLRRVDGHTPVDAREQFEIEQALLRHGMKFLSFCIACGAEFNLADGMMCGGMCGGFTCPACTDDETTCDHLVSQI